VSRYRDTLQSLYARAARMALRAEVYGWTAPELAYELQEAVLPAAREWRDLDHPGPLFRFALNRVKDHLAYVKERAERGIPPAWGDPEWTDWAVVGEALGMTASEAQYHHGLMR
jgi:hypothetical protein